LSSRYEKLQARLSFHFFRQKNRQPEQQFLFVPEEDMALLPSIMKAMQ